MFRVPGTEVDDDDDVCVCRLSIIFQFKILPRRSSSAARSVVITLDLTMFLTPSLDG